MADTRSVPVAGEVDAWCTACKRELNHIVVAKLAGVIKRVQCLTCGGQHAYRAQPSAPRPARAAGTASSPRRTAARAVDIPQHLPARDYLMSETFRSGDLLMHPSYGRGRVTQVRGNKIDVQFLGGARTLAHAAGK